MGKWIDITGQRFGKLVAICQAEPHITQSGNKREMWKCRCDCGNETIKAKADLIRNETKSCGCSHYVTGNKSPAYKHGRSKERLYTIHRGMLYRCENPSCNNYKYYGARGITVCDDWHNVNTFIDWALSHGYKNNLSLDRIDNNKGYEPANCRWADNHTQSTNRRQSHHIMYENNSIPLTDFAKQNDLNYSFVLTHYLKEETAEEILQNRPVIKVYEYNGKKYSLTQLARIANMSKECLWRRLNCGWSVKDAVEKPLIGAVLYEYNGEQYTIKELAKIANLPKRTVEARIENYHWSVERAVTEPRHSFQGRNKSGR